MLERSALHFDHIGLVVADLEEGRRHLTHTLGIARWTPPYDDQGIGVSVQFGVQVDAGQGEANPAIELIAPLGQRSPIANALRKGTRILNHLAYTTEDLESSAAHLAAESCVATGAAHPAVAYGGQRVQFFISPLRFMIELIEIPRGAKSVVRQRHVFLECEAEPSR
ncbi:MAG: VOC family protein [Acidobacteriota bacterium]|nr:VOC family protein [Acidobacteriota bacterium]